MFATCIEDLRVATSSLRAAPISWRRGDVRRADERHLVVWAQGAGTSWLRQADSEVRLGPGDVALCFTDEPFDLATAQSESLLAFRVPFARFGVPEGALHDRARAQHHPRGRAALVSAYLRELGTLSASDAFPADGSTVERTVELVAWAFLSDAEHLPTLGGSDEVQLDRVKRWIETRLRRAPPLSVREVAAEQAVSVRTLQRLFEHNDVPLAEYLVRRRLEGVRADLADPSMRRSTIAAIGRSWGFADQPHLTRIFRDRFGDTPSAHRHSVPPAC